MITLPRRSFLLGAATLAAPALIIRTPGLPPKVVPSLLMPEQPELVQVVYRIILHGVGRASPLVGTVPMTEDEFQRAAAYDKRWVEVERA